MFRARRVAPPIVLVAAVALASCQSMDEAPRPAAPAVAARLSPTGGSSMTGRATFWAVDGGVGMAIDFANVQTGQWRVVLHAEGNCTSPNGFSAGPPLAVPGVPSPIMVTLSTGDFLTGGSSFRLRGLALEGPNGVMGRSVVVHWGSVGSLEAQPGVPNNRFACGVIERVKPLF